MICFRLLEYQIKLIRGKIRKSYLYKNHTFCCIVTPKKKNLFFRTIAVFIYDSAIF